MVKIGFMGSPSTGKSALAKLTAGYAPILVENIKSADLVQEYARSYIQRYSFNDVAEQILLFDKQLDEEEEVHPNSSLLVTDSPIHLCFCYALETCIKEPSRRNKKYLAEINKRLIRYSIPSRYDIIFHCKPGVIPIVNDGVRANDHLSEDWSYRFDSIITSTLLLAPPKKIVTINTSDIEERIAIVLSTLDKYINEPTNLYPNNSI